MKETRTRQGRIAWISSESKFLRVGFPEYVVANCCKNSKGTCKGFTTVTCCPSVNIV